jgi:hypothetical protein
MSHLEDVKQTYFEHLIDSLKYATISFSAGVIFIIHGLFPDILNYAGSELINNLNILLENKRD